MLENTIITEPPAKWLIRISEVFSGFENEILQNLGADLHKRTGRDYLLVGIRVPSMIHHSEAAKYIRWNLPVHHSWPCSPQSMPGFVEKAAQALFQKFGDCFPQTLVAGPLDSSSSNR
jgi:23S rRNA (cytidine2498-2'-O)-methyltransferase